MAARALAIPLLTYLPGVALVWCTTGASSSRSLSPLPEILASVCLTSWFGLVLADAGWFSLGRLCIVLLGWTGLCVMVAVRRRCRRPTIGSPSSVAAALAIALVVTLLYLPAFDTSIMGSDASFYRAAGVHLARHGALGIDDPLLPGLTPGQRVMLFDRNVFGGWARIPGGFNLPTLGATTVYPSFAHLLPVWIGIAHAIGGESAIDLVGPLFAGLALWAIWLVARDAWGVWTASLAALLVATNLAQWFYARFLMPEILAQAFLWGGLLAFTRWWRDGDRAMALVAALGLGVAGLTRVEEMLLVPLAVGLFLGWQNARPRGTSAFVVAYGILVASAIAHLLLVPTHYRDVLRRQASVTFATLGQGSGTLLVSAAVLAAATAFVARRHGRTHARRACVTAFAAACTALYAMRSPIMLDTTTVWLAETTSWVVLAAATIGAVVVLAARPPALGLPLTIFAVVGLPFLWSPHVTLVQLWGIRRFVPVLIPWLGLLAAGTPALVGRRWRPLGPVLAGVLVIANTRPMSRLQDLRLFPSQADALQELAGKLPERAVVFVAPELTAYLVHLPLWTTHDREPFVLSPLRWQQTLTALVPTFATHHPVVYLGSSLAPAPAVEELEVRARADIALRTLTPELDPMRAPRRGTAHLVPLRVYDLSPRPPG